MREKNAPKLRFKGFSDDWEEKKIGKIATLIKDGTHGTHKDVEEGPYLLSAKNIKDGKIIITEDDRKISFEEYKQIYKNYQLMKNDILLSIVGTIGRLAIAPECDNIAFQRSVAILRFNKMNSNFIYQSMNTIRFQNELLKNQVVSAQPGIYLNDIKKLEIMTPSLKEQEKIANFLTKVDKIIEKQEEKVSSLENYKRGMMQKIFSQEIRFKKDDGGEYPEWKKKHLGDIIERVVRKNKGNITKRPLTISAQYGLVDQEEFFNKVVASSNLEGYYLLNKGEFAYNKSYSNGYPFGAIKRLDRYENGAVSTLYICFIPKENINSDYLVQYFESGMWHKEVSMIAVEGARNHGLLNISVSDLFETIHKVPCLEEQIKIAKFLSKVDSIVKKEKEKLEKLRCWKKGVLQQMFV